MKNILPALFSGRKKLFWALSGLVFVVIVGAAILFYAPFSPLARDSKSNELSENTTSKRADSGSPIATNSGRTDSGLGSPTYTNEETDTSFNYPSDWEIKSEYYYETAAGEKATVPTIILAKKTDTGDDDLNKIQINLRQKFCEGTASSQEDIGGIVVKFYSFPGQTTQCVQAELQGKDVNGKSATYNFVSYFESSEVLDVFKGVVSTFKVNN